MRRFANLAILTLLISIPVAHIAQSKRPELPFFDWNACPFEGCQYGQWTVLRPVVVYDTWKHTRRATTRLAEGDKVVAVTGVVITYKPGIIRANVDLPYYCDLKRGDIVYTYSYRGEGAWAVWLNGTYHDVYCVPPAPSPNESACREDCAGTVLQAGEKEWWAKIRLKSGKTAWVNMDKEFKNFDGVDSLG
jgi:hypothetical protein